jgi:hypothetical protein
MPSTVNGTVLSAQDIETLSFSAMGDVLEISNLIVMARSLVFDMLLSARQAEM